MEAPVANPQRASWREVIPNRPEVMLSSADAFENHLVLAEREGGLPFLRIVNLQATAAKDGTDLLSSSYHIEFREPAYNLSLGANPEFVSDTVRFQYESFVTPRSVFDYHTRTRERILLKQQPVLGGYDAGKYVSERLHATAADGTRIPISLVYRRGVVGGGAAGEAPATTARDAWPSGCSQGCSASSWSRCRLTGSLHTWPRRSRASPPAPS